MFKFKRKGEFANLSGQFIQAVITGDILSTRYVALQTTCTYRVGMFQGPRVACAVVQALRLTK